LIHQLKINKKGESIKDSFLLSEAHVLVTSL